MAVTHESPVRIVRRPGSVSPAGPVRPAPSGAGRAGGAPGGPPVSRRAHLRALGGAGLALGLLSACAPGVPADGGQAAGPQKAAPTPLRIWFHWSGVRGEKIKQMMDDYNATQGQADKNVVSVETVVNTEMVTKMTASVVGGDPPEVWHANAPPREATHRGLLAPVPREVDQYVRKSYVPGALERMVVGGKVWGYPTEFQAPAFVYRKGHYAEAGLSRPPTTTDEVLEQATKLTRRVGGAHERFGFPINPEWYASVLPALISRFGGQMVVFDGDRPLKLDLTSPAALEAVGWWRRLVELGVTQTGQTPYNDAMRQGQTSTTECFVWWVIGNTRDPGLTDIYQDLGTAVLPTKRGVKPVAYAEGWSLVGPQGAKQPEERWKLMRWMMHKPAMPFSKFIVEFVGSMAAPLEFPSAVEGWTPDLYRAWAVETPKIAQAYPMNKLLGFREMNAAIVPQIKGILEGELGLQTGLQQLNAQLNEILKRTESP